jgi:hypothetical protein
MIDDKELREQNDNSGLNYSNLIPPEKITAIYFMLNELTRARANPI